MTKKQLNKYCTIVGISIIIRVIMGILASKLSYPYMETDPNLSGDIFHMWDIGGQSLLALGIGIAFWRHYLAPGALAIAALQFGKVLDIYLHEAYKYNFNEDFFFVNVGLWFTYTAYTWKFKDFKLWYIMCIAIHIALIQYYLFKIHT